MNEIKKLIGNSCKRVIFLTGRGIMDTNVVAIYVVCDEVLKMLEIKDDSQALIVCYKRLHA